MRTKNLKNLEELSLTESQNVNGGWNLIEYIAYGAGYVAGQVVDFAEAFSDDEAYGERLLASGSPGGAK